MKTENRQTGQRAQPKKKHLVAAQGGSGNSARCMQCYRERNYIRYACPMWPASTSCHATLTEPIARRVCNPHCCHSRHPHPSISLNWRASPLDQQRWISWRAAPTNSEDFTSASKCARMETVPASCIMQKAILDSTVQNLLSYEKRQGEVWMEEPRIFLR